MGKEKVFLFLQSNLYPLLLVLITGIVCVLNYTPGTYLAGWDDLHPEFNFPLAVERVIHGVWRQNQGLGAVAVHSHMSELPRIAILWVLSLIFPLSFVRYAFFFGCLIVGPLGIYALAKKVLAPRNHTENILPFFAGLLYLLNLGTLQQFSVPFEMFGVQYALIGWICWLALQYLAQPRRTWLLAFLFIIILAAPMAFAATLWYAWFGCFVFFVLIAGGRRAWGRAVFLIGATLALNLYWILPNIYTAKVHGLDVRYSKVNQLFSPEAFAKNQLFGNPSDAVILKNFLFDWNIYNPVTGQYEQMLGPWIEHLATPLVPFFGHVVFGLSLLGIVWAVKEKNKKALALLPMYLGSLLMLLNGTWPMTVVFEQLGRISEVAREALRFPFTKFSILFLAALVVYASIGMAAIATWLRHAKAYVAYLSFLFCFWAFLYAAPVFTGNLIHPSMRISMPKEYFQLFDWFNRQDHNGRVAILPIHTFWNWVYYDWGYQGAGFLQFGMPQPLLDRDFDRWNPANEQYQREMAYAIYSQKPENVSQVLAKYNIRWILFDTAIISPGAASGSTLSWFIPQLLDSTSGVEKAQTFGSTLSVYEVTSTGTNQVALSDYLPSVGPDMIGAPTDLFFATNGPYLTKPESNDLVDDTRKFFSRDERFIGPTTGTVVADVTAQTADTNTTYCDSTGKATGSLTNTAGVLMYTSTNGPLCDYFSFPTLAHDKAYLVRVTSRNVQGFPLQLCISNDLTRHCSVSVHLHKRNVFETETFLLPPVFDYGASYTLNFNNFAITKTTSSNELKEIIIEEVPFADIAQPPTALPAIENRTGIIAWKKLSQSSHVVTLDTKSTQNILTLNQAFEKGWNGWQIEACGKQEVGSRKLDIRSRWQGVLCTLGIQFPYLFGTKIDSHVVVNNWANGWQIQAEYKLQEVGSKKLDGGEKKLEVREKKLDGGNDFDSSPATNVLLPTSNILLPISYSQRPITIVLFFLPQLLQWLGFLLFPLPFIFLIKK